MAHLKTVWNGSTKETGTITADMGCHAGNLLKRADAEIKIEDKIIFE